MSKVDTDSRSLKAVHFHLKPQNTSLLIETEKQKGEETQVASLPNIM